MHAICVNCGDIAVHSYRKTVDISKTINAWRKESYEPRCRKCFREK
ncbi:MAG: hypothetical protein R2836_01525 [Chitinophagales bacterium]